MQNGRGRDVPWLVNTAINVLCALYLLWVLYMAGQPY